MLRNSKREYVYVLKLVNRLLNEKNWTEEDNNLVEKHFKYLQNLLANDSLILAGKTDGLDAKTFGIVIFKAYNEEEAQEIMEGDPAVKGKIMNAELFPYKIALKSF